jgi:pimeloyl-ACP methyl ester carboxylesterase
MTLIPGTRTELVQTRGLRFEVTMAGGSGPGDKLALLLHGFPECAYSWREQIPLLAKLGYRVWAPNLRGYGKSDRPLAVTDYTIDKLEQDVADLIEASGAESVVLIGHDWGAVIAWSFAMYNPGKLERLVIMNVPHPARMQRGLRTWKQLRKSWYMLFFQIRGLPERVLSLRDFMPVGRAFREMAVHKERFTDEVLEVFKRNAAEPGGLTGMLNYYRAIPYAYGLLKKRGMPKIETKTLMIWGEQDTALGKELTYGTDHHVSDLTLRYIADASHWVQQDRPDAVNAMLSAFLSEQPVPEATAL